MLSPDVRETLLDALRPAPGDRLDAAVATTGTLDLIAALVPPLALATFARRNLSDPVTTLEAVRRVNSRVDVFVQAGQLRVPSTADRLAFLERMVHPVRSPAPGHVFHPSLWLVRYVGDDDGCRYRLLCLTRGLTDGSGWDAVLRLDGRATLADQPANAPLAALIGALPDLAVRPLPPERIVRIQGLADEVRAIEWEHPAGVEEIAFHVYGLGATDTADFSGARQLLISPLCTDGGVALVAPGPADRTIVSGAEQLDRLAPATLAGARSYVLDRAAGLLSPDAEIREGLHANVYVVERDGRAHLFLGSATATEAAFHGNVELLVELVGPPTVIGIDAILGPTPSLRDVLEEYPTPGGEPAPDDDPERLAAALRALAQVEFTLTVSPQTPGFDLVLASDGGLDPPPGTRLTVELLTRLGETVGAPFSHVYRGLEITEVTPFLVLRLSHGSGRSRATVVPARLIADPADRLDEILADQIDSTDSFLRFVSALLGRSSEPSSWDPPGLFELLVRGLADHPEAIAELDGLVTRLDSTDRGTGVLPEGFPALWRTVTAALDRLTDRRRPSAGTKRAVGPR